MCYIRLFKILLDKEIRLLLYYTTILRIFMQIFTSATKEVVTKLREGKLSNNKLIMLELNMNYNE